MTSSSDSYESLQLSNEYNDFGVLTSGLQGMLHEEHALFLQPRLGSSDTRAFGSPLLLVWTTLGRVVARSNRSELLSKNGPFLYPKGSRSYQSRQSAIRLRRGVRWWAFLDLPLEERQALYGA